MKIVEQKSQGEKPQYLIPPQWGIIEIEGLKFADSNLGTDMDNPCGKYYNWGEAMEACPKGWRLPTKEEWAKFCENTAQEWLGNKVVIKGMKFTDEVTGKFLFLPAMGWDSNIEKNVVNSYGRHWSSTCHPNGTLSYCLWYNRSGFTVLKIALPINSLSAASKSKIY